MNAPLEDRVHDSLHRTVDPLQRSPLTVGDVRSRARRIQRRRTIAAGAAVAAVLAIAVPVGLGLNGPAQRTEAPPVTRTPQVTGPVRIDPRSAEVGTPRACRSSTPPDRAPRRRRRHRPAEDLRPDHALPGRLDRRDQRRRHTHHRRPGSVVRHQRRDGDNSRSPSPRRTRVAWAVLRRSALVDPEPRRRRRPGRAPDGAARPALRRRSGHPRLPVRRRGAGLPAEPGRRDHHLVPRSGEGDRANSPGSTSPERLTRHRDDRRPRRPRRGRSCGAVFDGRTRSRSALWTDVRPDPGRRSTPTASLVVRPPRGGRRVGLQPRRGVRPRRHDRAAAHRLRGHRGAQPLVGIAAAIWEDDRTLLATYVDGTQQYVVRLGLDGTVERVAGPVTNDDDTVSLRLTPGDLDRG